MYTTKKRYITLIEIMIVMFSHRPDHWCYRLQLQGQP